VLSGKRALTLEMIRKLHGLFGIPLESLIGPTAVPKKRKSASVGRRGRAARPRGMPGVAKAAGRRGKGA
jgi:hypothetical protein